MFFNRMFTDGIFIIDEYEPTFEIETEKCLSR
jgi:hypothetical protein